MQKKEWDHLLDLWAMRLDYPRKKDYFQPLVQKFRQARQRSNQRGLTAEKWALLPASKVGEDGKRFLCDTKKRVTVRMHVCYVTFVNCSYTQNNSKYIYTYHT
jgi:hypothetical protein